ncbi:MAG: hypothetical protein ACN4EP_15285 [Sediminibacterium sp.]
MRKLKILATPRRVILFLILAVLVWFILLPKVDKLEFIGAVLITLLSYEGICLLLPDDLFKRFRRKERNPLLEE